MAEGASAEESRPLPMRRVSSWAYSARPVIGPLSSGGSSSAGGAPRNPPRCRRRRLELRTSAACRNRSIRYAGGCSPAAPSSDPATPRAPNSRNSAALSPRCGNVPSVTARRRLRWSTAWSRSAIGWNVESCRCSHGENSRLPVSGCIRSYAPTLSSTGTRVEPGLSRNVSSSSSAVRARASSGGWPGSHTRIGVPLPARLAAEGGAPHHRSSSVVVPTGSRSAANSQSVVCQSIRPNSGSGRARSHAYASSPADPPSSACRWSSRRKPTASRSMSSAVPSMNHSRAIVSSTSGWASPSAPVTPSIRPVSRRPFSPGCSASEPTMAAVSTAIRCGSRPHSPSRAGSNRSARCSTNESTVCGMRSAALRSSASVATSAVRSGRSR